MCSVLRPRWTSRSSTSSSRCRSGRSTCRCCRERWCRSAEFSATDEPGIAQERGMTPGPRGLGPALQDSWMMANLLAFTFGGALTGGVLRFLGQPYYGSNLSVMEAAQVQATIQCVSFGLFGAVLGTL